jgi:hypothetical protein
MYITLQANQPVSHIFHDPVTFSGEGGVTFTVSASSTLKGSATRLGSPGVASVENALANFNKTDEELFTYPRTRVSNLVKRGAKKRGRSQKIMPRNGIWSSNRLVF